MDRVLRISRSDSDGHVLVRVERRPSTSDLDAKLIGTEGESPYVLSLTNSQVKKLRAANYHGNDAEWEALLSAILFQDDPNGAAHLDGVETVAMVGSGGDMSIVVRKNIGGITQRLGTLVLRLDENEVIELFDWTSAAALAATEAQQKAAALQSRLEEQQATVAKLTAQLEQLALAKKEHEAALLDKFRLLLNAKKQKIRDQQRLLASAQVDRNSAENVESTRNKTSLKPRRAGHSRTGKRKASTPELPDVGTAALESEDAAKTDEDGAASDALTPERSDLDETEDEDGSDTMPSTSGPGSKAMSIVVANGKKAERLGKDGTRQQSPKEEQEPPPRRVLPFLRHKSSANAEEGSAVETEPMQAEGDDEETEDEL